MNVKILYWKFDDFHYTIRPLVENTIHPRLLNLFYIDIVNKILCVDHT